jgi:uncharacterized membrane protein
LQTGILLQVALIDKLIVALIIIPAMTFLGETLTKKMLLVQV